MQSKLKINFDSKSKCYDEVAQTTKASTQSKPILPAKDKKRDITPNRFNKNGSFYLNFKLFDSTVINEARRLNETRVSQEEGGLPTDPDNIHLPTIGQSGKLDSKISQYTSGYSEFQPDSGRVSF